MNIRPVNSLKRKQLCFWILIQIVTQFLFKWTNFKRSYRPSCCELLSIMRSIKVLQLSRYVLTVIECMYSRNSENTEIFEWTSTKVDKKDCIITFRHEDWGPPSTSNLNTYHSYILILFYSFVYNSSIPYKYLFVFQQNRIPKCQIFFSQTNRLSHVPR